MMKLGLLLCAATAVAAIPDGSVSAEVRAQFDDFKLEFGKSYSPSEHEARLRIFAANVATAESWNTGKGATFGVTQYSDLTPDEFRARYTNYIAPEESTLEPLDVPDVDLSAPEFSAVNWYGNLTTPVKDQGHCGSCWAFSATEQIESMWIKKYDRFQFISKLSVQQIVSCDDDGHDKGCKGGNTETAYKYVESAGGMVHEHEYPYSSGTSGRTGECERRLVRPTYIRADIEKGMAVGKKDEVTMQRYVASQGPLSICVNAQKWQHYKQGVLDLSQCPDKKTDHCVQIVGFNAGDPEDSYWIVRNSWNTTWGLGGFIHLSMGENTCDLASDPTTVIIK